MARRARNSSSREIPALRSSAAIAQFLPAPCATGLASPTTSAPPWTTAARKVRSRPCLGQSGPLTGHLLFTKINFNLAVHGLQQVLLPPPRPRFDLNPVGPLTITNTRGTIALKLRVSASPGQMIVVLGYPPVSPGVSFARDFTILGVLPPPDAGFSDITDLYKARYGVPAVSKRVFIRTLQQINGWQDLPKQTTALVPTP